MSAIEYINSQVISSGVTSVTFSNIPSNYADLILSANVVGSANAYPFLVINGSGGSISRLWLSGNGSSASSNKLSDSYIVGGVNWTTTTPEFITETTFLNYANQNMFKTFLTSVGNASVGTELVVNCWRSTNSITSIQYLSSSGNLNPGSNFTLWGVR
jgi:hypothetical protein